MVWKAVVGLAIGIASITPVLAQDNGASIQNAKPWLEVDAEKPAYTAFASDAVAWVYGSQVRRTSYTVGMWIWHRVYAADTSLPRYREFIEIDCDRGAYRTTAFDLMGEDWEPIKSEPRYNPWEPARPQTLPDILRGEFCTK